MSDTPTPRTDDIAGSLIDAEEVVSADFARTLERELAEQAARLRDEIARRQEVVRANRKLDLEERDQLRAAIDAARKEAK